MGKKKKKEEKANIRPQTNLISEIDKCFKTGLAKGGLNQKLDKL